MSDIRALLFDMGGVVIEIDFERAIRSWSTQSRLSIDEIRNRFSMDEVYEKHERGEIGVSVYFGHLRDQLELTGDDDAIQVGWNAIFCGEITETIQDIMHAKSKMPCSAFTNTNPTHQAVWIERYPQVVAAFERVFVSSEMGLRKPEKAAFEAIGKAMNLPLSSILFFDDSLGNVEGARAAGLEAVHVRSPGDVRRVLLDLELL